jgi:hypothetical protein
MPEMQKERLRVYDRAERLRCEGLAHREGGKGGREEGRERARSVPFG